MKKGIEQLHLALGQNGKPTPSDKKHPRKERVNNGPIEVRQNEKIIIQLADHLEEKRTVENKSLIASILQNIAHLREN